VAVSRGALRNKQLMGTGKWLANCNVSPVLLGSSLIYFRAEEGFVF